jgi:hypothetical protein
LPKAIGEITAEALFYFEKTSFWDSSDYFKSSFACLLLIRPAEIVLSSFY